MSEWNARHYLQYADERTRPAMDLAARIQLTAPRHIVDLGCGPGNSTQVLRARWPKAEVTGVDSSEAMISTAREAYPDQRWIVADAASWAGDERLDLAFSNAALQWVPDHLALTTHLLSMLSEGGALAFQIPSSTFTAVRTHIHELSLDPRWTDQLAGARAALTLHDPAFYYDALVRRVKRMDIWETEYQHVLDGCEEIIDWMSSTGLRPFLNELAEPQQLQFLAALRTRVADSYPSRVDGRVLFPFRRLFVIAYR